MTFFGPSIITCCEACVYSRGQHSEFCVTQNGSTPSSGVPGSHEPPLQSRSAGDDPAHQELSNALNTTCGWCRAGDTEIGAHHAANCRLYRSPFVGADAEYWDKKLRDRLLQVHQIFLTSRSRALEYQRCPRARYWLHEANGTGYELVRQSIPLATGSATHLVYASLLRGESVQDAIKFGLDWHDQACRDRGLQVEVLQDESRLYAEQRALIEALGWLGHYRVLPRLLQIYEVLEVEQMDTPKFYNDGKIDIVWRSITDALLRDRESGDLYILSLKTCAEYGKKTEQEARVDMQGISEAWALESRLNQYWQNTRVPRNPGDPLAPPNWFYKSSLHLSSIRPDIRGIQMLYLVKGRKIPVAGQDSQAEYKSWRTNSPLIYAYHDQSFPPKLAWGRDWRCSSPHPMRKSQWYPNGECPGDGRKHKRGDDWESKGVWEFGTVVEWMERLHTRAITPEAGDPLETCWVMPTPQFRTREASESWLTQARTQEKRVSRVIQEMRLYEDAITTAMGRDREIIQSTIQAILDECWPQYTHNCNNWFGGQCPAWEICWGPAHVAQDPVGSGFYQVRTPYKPTEQIVESVSVEVGE